MHIDFLRTRFQQYAAAKALIWRERAFSYQDLKDAISQWADRLAAWPLPSHQVVLLQADFSPNALALLLALIQTGAIVVPLTSAAKAQTETFSAIAEVEQVIRIDDSDTVHWEPTGRTARHDLLTALKARRHAGLILFSSGSSGQSKAALHDFEPLLDRLQTPGRPQRTLAFLLFDHIGGLNTLLHTLASGGCVVTVADRSPAAICRAIATHQVAVLPTSPTFINLLLLSGAFKDYDLSSLRLVTYGTEVMPATTLARFHQLFPQVKLLQTYGLSETGILKTRSQAPDSLWIRISDPDTRWRIVDGILHLKVPTTMLGYLNAPSPMTDDGWFNTGDQVEVDGDYLRILGRDSDIINVGGEKVYPTEVEEVLQMMPDVLDVAVTGTSNPLTGQMVTARVRLNRDESLSDFRRRMRAFCKDRLPAFKIPQKVMLTREDFHGGRFKKIRRLKN